MKRLTRAATAMAVSVAAALPAHTQTLALRADRTRVTVGDVVTVQGMVRLPPGAIPTERLLRTAEVLPDTVRLVGADTLRSTPGALTVRARVVFLRVGTQATPAFVVPYRMPNGARDSLLSRPIEVEVASVLPSSRAGLRDIKPLATVRVPLRVWYTLALAVALVAIAVAALVRHRSRLRQRTLLELAEQALQPTPYEVARSRLAAIADAGLAAQGQAAEQMERVAEVLRRYLEDAHQIPALERTTQELFWTLPPALAAEPLGRACRGVLDDADLAKFARWQPNAADAAEHLARAERLLDRWHEATAEGATAVTHAAR